jgi:hypothetical protein
MIAIITLIFCFLLYFEFINDNFQIITAFQARKIISKVLSNYLFSILLRLTHLTLILGHARALQYDSIFLLFSFRWPFSFYHFKSLRPQHYWSAHRFFSISHPARLITL